LNQQQLSNRLAASPVATGGFGGLSLQIET